MHIFDKKHFRVSCGVTFILLMTIGLLGGCWWPTGVPISPTESPTIVSETPNQLNSTSISSTPVASPIAGVTLTTLPPEDILKFQLFVINSELSSDVRPFGALVIGSEPLQLLRFEPDVHLETIAGIDPNTSCLATSPDGKWLACSQVSSDSETAGQWLIVESADWQQQIRIPMDMHLAYFGAYLWLDNQRLIFPLVQGEHQTAYPVVVINPFTSEQVKLTSDYPDLHLSPAGPATSMDFNFSDVVYDPSLEYVIFPSWGGEHNYIVLWDRQSNSEVAKVENHGQVFGHYPLWSPDAKQVAVAVVNREDNRDVVEEWYSVGRDGLVAQLTHFGDYFTSAEIDIANWSPDGRKLAFWLDVAPSLCPGLNLAVLDISTKQVTDTCIPGVSDYAPPPIWSLDSRYIVVVNARTKPRQTILVDTAEGQAFDITDMMDGARPIGWLVSP